MKRLPFRLLAIAALAFALASCGDDDDPADVGTDDTEQVGDNTADCDTDQPDCEDTGSDPAMNACPVDNPDCGDTGADAEPSMNMCAPDAPDCSDTVVEDPDAEPVPSE